MSSAQDVYSIINRWSCGITIAYFVVVKNESYIVS